MIKRSSGVLLPIFSLPSKYGIGSFGKEAYNFIDFLYEANQKYWQILPLSEPFLANSPYSSTSILAINPYFIDIDDLVKRKLLSKKEAKDLSCVQSNHKVNYRIISKKYKKILPLVAKRLLKKDKKNVYNFINNNGHWLYEYSLYMTLKEKLGKKSFYQFKKDYKYRKEEVIEKFIKDNQDRIDEYKAIQYLLFSQWFKLKEYANKKNIKIIGDTPIYCALESSECYFHKNLFLFNEDYTPKVVAGCPPDIYSKNGQLWGNPIFDYEYIKNNNYKYFKYKFSHLSKLYDVIRLDHFRGYASYFAIPYGSKTAKNGKWMKGPGIEFFNNIKKECKNIDIIAEDLGFIDSSVKKLLKDTGLPGMNVLQFSFDNIKSKKVSNKIDKFKENSVSYISTHDSDTWCGFIKSQKEKNKKLIFKSLNIDINDKMHYKKAIQKVYECKSKLVIVLMQDLLGIGKKGRINTPALISSKNWSYRFDKNYINDDIKNYLKNLTIKTKRG